jgi:hypothetical protein
MNPEIAHFVQTHPMVTTTPLEIRDAFYGGRVNCSKLYHKANVRDGEKIFYMDFTSLYPTVNKVNNISYSSYIIPILFLLILI